jgi:peroxiredoxin
MARRRSSKAFATGLPNFTALGLRLFGLSLQATDYQRELVMRLALPFPLLSDAEGAFGAALCLPAFATGGTTYLKRLTLLVADGRIERVFYPVIDPAAHAAEVLRMLEKGQER